MSFLRADLAKFSAYSAPHPIEEPVKALDGLDTNESPIDLPDDLKAALATQYEQAIAANRYPDGGHLQLKQAVLDYAVRSSEISPDAISLANITLGNGSDELIRSIIMATCLGGHGSILVSEPTFSMYGILAKTLGVPVYGVARNEETFEADLAAADSAIAQSHAPSNPSTAPVRVVFMVHPNSPTGNALTAQELAWMKQLPEDILVVVDEAYFEFSGHTTLAEALSRPNWMITRTFSKAFRLAAHRVGYGIAHPDIICTLEKLRLPYNLPSFSQAAAQAALTHSELLLAQIPDILAERKQLIQALSGHPHLRLWPSNSNFIYARLSDTGMTELGFQSQAAGLDYLHQQLQATGTLVRLTGGGLRISIGTAAENRRTVSNLRQVLTSKQANSRQTAETTDRSGSTVPASVV
ncbi:MAG: histidinol-phosphate transaminase [Cyanobacteria bacterium J06623_4]